MESFNKKMTEICASDSNTMLQLSFYDLEHYLTHSKGTPDFISKTRIKTTMSIFAKMSVEVCERINNALEECESNE